MEKSIITSCSNKFFPTAITLIASIKAAYPDHPTIFVYDLGLFPLFRKELENTDNVKVIPMPAFCPHWKSCYTWKTYILAHPPARLNLYLDSGIQVLKDLEQIFREIDQNDFFAVGQNSPLELIAPAEFKSVIKIDERFYQETYITAGLFGFKRDSSVTSTLDDLYESAIAGLCLGFSPAEKWRNRGKNKNPFVRDCKLFRFDTSVMSLLMRRDFGDFKINPWEPYEMGMLLADQSQLMWNARLKIIPKEYLAIGTLHTKASLVPLLNRLYIHLFLGCKRFSNQTKNRIRGLFGKK